MCLSLLGTWTGPSWNGATSTLLQVLLRVTQTGQRHPFAWDVRLGPEALVAHWFG